MKTWLVLDVSYLCHRAFHTMQDLSYHEKPTGVIFGFLKSISALKDEFQTDRIAFCFDSRHSLRREIYPPYKLKRRVDQTNKEKALKEELAIQICELRKRYLPKIGFNNVFCYRGYESDDIMAEIARASECDEQIILVTSDSDLLQCLSSNVMIYSPHKRRLLTDVWFTKEYGIHPDQWVMVKSIAGCITDEVEGIKGVGEVTALKHLKRELDKEGKAYQAIVSAEGKAIIARNRALVRLPYKGCPTPDRVDDEIDRKGWREVCGRLGMRSIAGHPPVATRKRR